MGRICHGRRRPASALAGPLLFCNGRFSEGAVMQARRQRWGQRIGLGGLALVVGLSLSAVSGQEGKKKPIPPADAQA